MKIKRGQVTVFMIIGLVIIFVLFILVYFKSVQVKKIGKETEGILDLDINNIKNFVDNCVKDVGEDSLELAGKQGGYTEIKDNMLATFYGFFPYIYDEGNNKLISKKEMQNQISLYINEYLPECINNFSSFKGLNIKQGKIETQTLIGKKDVTVVVDYPIKIMKKDSEIEISKFTSNFNIRLSHIYDIINFTVERLIKDDGWIDVTYMSDFDIEYTIYPHNSTVLIFSITDNQSILNYKPYLFIFANRFTEVKEWIN